MKKKFIKIVKVTIVKVVNVRCTLFLNPKINISFFSIRDSLNLEPTFVYILFLYHSYSKCIFILFNTDSSAALFDINEFDTLQIFLHTREVRFFGLCP